MDISHDLRVNENTNHNERKENGRTATGSTQHHPDGLLLRPTSVRRPRLEERAKALPHFGIRTLKQYRGVLTKQQIRTLRGQILAGETEAAEKGLNNILIQKVKCNG